MSLVMRKGKEASREYENSFFRAVANSLKPYFDSENIDGILIGFPEVPEDARLRPDCVLITKSRIVIIDFKKYDTNIFLPDEHNFDTGSWKSEKGIIVKGGKLYRNPFDQLKNYREFANKIIGEVTLDDIACIVCFHHEVTIINDVPGRYASWFSVTDQDQYIQAIRDAIEINPYKTIDINAAAKHFKAKEYTEFRPIKIETTKSVSEAKKVLQEKSRIEYRARQLEKEAEAKLRAAEENRNATSTLRQEAEMAKFRAERAAKDLEKAKQFYDGKRHELDLEINRTEQAKAKAAEARAKQKAETENRKAAEAKLKTETLRHSIEMEKIEEARREREAKFVLAGKKIETQKKVAKITAITLTICAIIAFGILIIIRKQREDNLKRQKEEEAAQLEQAYLDGTKCMPIERVKDFVGKNVCVEYYVGDVKDNSYFIYLKDNGQELFEIVISKKLKILTKEEAKNDFLNKRVQVRGEIKIYKDSYEIMPTSLSQIELKK